MEFILVTGANGFIGSNLVRRLVEEGNIVRGLVRNTSNLGYLEGLNVELMLGDITDPYTLDLPMRGIDKVYHIAGLAADWGPYETFEKINFHGTINVARAAEKNKVKKFIYASTVAFHGFGKTEMNEESPLGDFLIPYSQTKFLAEQWLWEFSKKSPMKITAVRPGNVYGINDRTFISKYLDAMVAGKFAQIDNGKRKTCPIYIENLVDIFILVGNSPTADGQAFIATDGLDIDWNTFNHKLAEALGLKLKIFSLPYWFLYPIAIAFQSFSKIFFPKIEPFINLYRLNNGGRDYHFSIKKLKSYFNYNPKIGIDEAIQNTVNWYLKK